MRIATRQDFIKLSRHPYLRIVWETESPWKDSNNPNGLILKSQSYRGKVCPAVEVLSPIPVTDQSSRSRPETLLLRRETASQDRLHSHDLQEVARNSGDHCPSRVSASRNRLQLACCFRQTLQGTTL